MRDVVELLRDFLRAKALTESEISREVGSVVWFLCARGLGVDRVVVVLCVPGRGGGRALSFSYEAPLFLRTAYCTLDSNTKPNQTKPTQTKPNRPNATHMFLCFSLRRRS